MEPEIIAAIFTGLATLTAAIGYAAHRVFKAWLSARAEELKSGAAVNVMDREQVRAVLREEIQREREMQDALIVKGRLVPLESRVKKLETDVTSLEQRAFA